ncbi:hypothetical protein C8J56DRAFT_1046983 [Mycena floridula]|nr:hypothetical protein C8J56DRAFT_1046983 [Mycena floridula]
MSAGDIDIIILFSSRGARCRLPSPSKLFDDMVKQSRVLQIFGLPSRKYSFPTEQHLFSEKSQILSRLQVATEANIEHKPLSHEHTAKTVVIETDSQSPISDVQVVELVDEDSDDEEAFYTPNTSPRSSMASAVSAFPAPLTALASSPSSSSLTTLDSQSIFSASDHSYSTRLTSPLASESSHSNGHRSSATYTDEDWAKDVQHVPRTRATKHSVNKAASSSSPVSLSFPSRPQHSSKSMSKATPSIMMSMSALLEEDEDRDGPAINALNLTPNPKSRVLINGATAPRSRPTSRSSNRQQNSNRPTLSRRRSRSLEDLPIRTESYAPSIPSHGTPGYTSLTLPRAPPPPFAPVTSSSNSRLSVIGVGNGKIDLTRSGVAQTTMASVEVVRGLGLQNNGKGVLGGFGSILSRKRTVSSSTVTRSSSRSKSSTGSPLTFTSYRQPPSMVPGSNVLVQVWGVGLDRVDTRLVGGGAPSAPSRSASMDEGSGGITRSVSLRSRLRRSQHKPEASDNSRETTSADVGFVPGRSFVGRVLECGWDVSDDIVRRGDWVVGLLEIKKSGALQEFILVDRHRVYRIPHPIQGSGLTDPTSRPSSPSHSADSVTRSNESVTSSSPLPYSRYPSHSSSLSRRTSSASNDKSPLPSLTVDEFSLLALCGVPAYRAVRTISVAFTSSPAETSDRETKRVLVLRGNDGPGAIAVQMLARKGWRVCAHAPLPIFNEDQGNEEKASMENIQDRVRGWGAEEIVFDDGGDDMERAADRGDDGRGAVVRVIERLLEDGDMFDAVLDTIGGKEVWEASERLLRGVGSAPGADREKKGVMKAIGLRSAKRKPNTQTPKQFTTLVGDFPERPIPSASDLFKAGLRSMRSNHKAQERDGSSIDGKVRYAWISAAHDVDWEGEDIRDSLGAVVRMALNEGIRPYLGDKSPGGQRTVPFERAPLLFVNRGLLYDGGAAVVKVVC